MRVFPDMVFQWWK